MGHSTLNTGNFVLYDDDCGICTKFSRILGKLLHRNTKILAMHTPYVEEEGMLAIPEDYWKSFHVIKGGNWYTEGQAIIQLSTLFPLGRYLSQAVQVPFVYSVLTNLLILMQRKRQSECKILN
ncbi:MAG: DCC1-like thiol-disulfide oxidoreductase family protein [Candidatus Kariarchaeaceae archaeon]|jgi:predicted DCC family thiol-disulfide oxidoreductase YuxK